MKPKIFKDKSKNMWTLVYGYYPRQMWLFGANQQDRERITSSCITHIYMLAWEETLKYLYVLYKNREIRLK